ncbi:MAG: hypothetical protein N2201_05695 [candidate division WOR-3 bacterium]|nr:hypothetical protein [candidate division WOR-3 bacterium]
MISWKVHRAKEFPKKTLYVSLILGIFIIFLIFFYGIFWAIFASIVLFASLNAYFLPTTYTLTDNEIIIDKKLFKNKLEWNRFRKYYITSTGIVLSPFTKKNFLDNFRGIHLLLPKENSAEIIEFIKNKLDKPQDLG